MAPPVRPGIPLHTFPTPRLSDRVVLELLDAATARQNLVYPDTPHPNTEEYAGYVFVTQRPWGENDQFVQRIWVNPRTAQDTYNAETVSYLHESAEHPIFVRRYLERRDRAMLPMARGAALTGILGCRVTAGGSGYTAAPTVTFTGPGTGASAFAVVFRGAVVALILEAEGTGYTPEATIALTGGGGTGATAEALVQPVAAVLVAEAVEQLAEDDPLHALYVAIRRTYHALPGPERRTRSIGQDNLTPQKFRRLIATTVTRSDVPAATSLPSALAGDETRVEIEDATTAIAEQRITEEAIAVDADPLVGEQVGESTQGQRATVTESLVDDGTPADEGKLVLSSEVDPLGNGKSVKRTVTIPQFVTLFGYEKGQEELTPAKYRRLTTRRTSAEIDDPPADPGTHEAPDPTGDQVRIREQMESETRMRREITEEVIATDGDPLLGERVSDSTQGQRATVTESLVDEGSAADTGKLVLSSEVDPLGNGKSIKRTVAIPEFVPLYQYEKGTENLTPPKYRGLTTRRIREEVDDTPVDPETHEAPALTGDETQVRETMETESRLKRQVTEEVIDVSAEPLLGEQVSDATQGQRATVTESLVEEGDPADTGKLVLSSEVDPLGNGKSVKRTVAIPEFVPLYRYEKGTPDLTPAKFRGLTTRRIRAEVDDVPLSPETHVAPNLTGLETQVRETMETETRMRREITEEEISVTAESLPGSVKGIYGVNETVEDLVYTGAEAETGFGVKSSRVSPVGNGTAILETEYFPDDPATLASAGVEEQTDLITHTERTLVDPEDSLTKAEIRREGSGTRQKIKYRSIQPIDADNAESIETWIDPESIDDYAVVVPSIEDLQFPAVLVSVTPTVETSTGTARADTEGDGFSAGTSAHLSMSDSARSSGSASLMPDLQTVIQEIDGTNRPVTHCVFFMKRNPTRDAILTKLRRLLGDTVSAWPDFQPQTVSFTLKGERASVNSDAGVHQTVSLSSSTVSRVKGKSFGRGKEFSTTVRTFQIRPTIHAEITLAGAVSGAVTYSTSVDAVARAQISGGTNWVAVDTSDITVSGAVTARITPAVIEATPGVSSISAALGKRIYRLQVEPYKLGYDRVFARVFDFATLAAPV